MKCTTCGFEPAPGYILSLGTISKVPICPSCNTIFTSVYSTGIKYDKDKPRWDLLPYDTVGQVVDVLTFGAAKYADNNWKKVPDARRRYVAAAMRHFTAWIGGERKDQESNIHHLAHAICCLIFLLWLDDNEPKEPNVKINPEVIKRA